MAAITVDAKTDTTDASGAGSGTPAPDTHIVAGSVKTRKGL